MSVERPLFDIDVHEIAFPAAATGGPQLDLEITDARGDKHLFHDVVATARRDTFTAGERGRRVLECQEAPLTPDALLLDYGTAAGRRIFLGGQLVSHEIRPNPWASPRTDDAAGDPPKMVMDVSETGSPEPAPEDEECRRLRLRLRELEACITAALACAARADTPECREIIDILDRRGAR